MRYPARIPREIPGSKRERREGDCPEHRKFVRSQPCIIGNADCAGRVQCCHVRTAANSGTGMKPHDKFSYPGCAYHHDEQHRVGQPEFERRYSISLLTAAAQLAQRSPALRRMK